MKLISMTEFCLNQIESNTDKAKMGGVAKSLHQINEYAKFLSKPLTLGMFVPCDEDGNVLEEPKKKYVYSWNPNASPNPKTDQYKQYTEAKERVLFDGFELVEIYKYGFDLVMKSEDWSEQISLMNEDTIEDLLTCSFDPGFELNESAIKQLGL